MRWDTTQSALQCIITPVTGFIINPALIMHLLNSLGSILARRHFRGAHMPHQATNNVRILLGTHLYTWVKSSNVDKVSCWRTKMCQALTGIEPATLFIQSQGFNPIYHWLLKSGWYTPLSILGKYLKLYILSLFSLSNFFIYYIFSHVRWLSFY